MPLPTTTLMDSGKLRIEAENHGLFLLIRPVGVIDEDANLSVILSTASPAGSGNREVRFDLSKVTRLNSCGVREWLLLIERLAPRCELKFDKVSEIFLQQANVNPNFLGRRPQLVISFETPYHCPNCDREMVKWLRPSDVTYAEGRPVPPAAVCETCGKPLVFEWDGDEYFGFLKRL